MLRLAALMLILMGIAPASGRELVVSDKAEDVMLTVYRDPERTDTPIDRHWPSGYALITETRNIAIPAGESLIRFEGVAEGMLPESAIVTGLPAGVREKNRDARLLSPAGLVDAYLRREVTITRTNKATGKSSIQSAMITAGPAGGVILRTATGYEALHCTGLPERMGYDSVPQNLSARPTLSVLTSAKQPVTAKVTLTYMAAGFDWQANYIWRNLSPPSDGQATASLFAWLTIANGGDQSFAHARLMAIAGRPNREAHAEQPRPTGEALHLQCWPDQRTHQVPYRQPSGNYGGMPVPPPPMMAAPALPESIMVTARESRAMLADVATAMIAEQEDLGDLKLYRIPERVTVNAKGQKQIALMGKDKVRYRRVYRGAFGQEGPLRWTLLTENKSANGLGLPLPQGAVAIFEPGFAGPLLAGESTLTDVAVGEELEIEGGASAGVRLAMQTTDKSNPRRTRLTVSNARTVAVDAEITIPYALKREPAGVAKIRGVPTWKVTVPAGGKAEIEIEPKRGETAR